MKSSEIRAAFLDYFRSNGHKIVPSSPLIPWADPTLIFVNAGMVQFKKIFLGSEKAPFARATTCQKCMRAGGKHSDLENVGHTARHHTFFEMLGNFSFGDYFKRQAIMFGWDLLTEHFKLPKERLYATVYEEDDEAAELWPQITGLPENRIVRLGAKDNFWQMGDTGPCGPCSEIIIDQGSHMGCGKADCSVGCDCDRFLELWNLVFMQFNRDESGSLTPLPKPSIDTGMGLERITAVLQGKQTNFDTDLFEPIIAQISSLSGVTYGSSVEKTASIRVIADHIRAIVFMLSEGCVPSNEGRGYVLRRIIRRASRHAKLLNIHEPCLYALTDSVISAMGGVYPDIVNERSRTEKLLRIEEENFHRTVESAMNVFDDVVARTKKEGLTVIPGEEVARLQQTHGLPLDFAKDIAMDAGLAIDEEAFHKGMASHREKSKASAAAAHAGPSASGDDVYSGIEKSEFVGYDTLTSNAVVRHLYKNGLSVDSLTEGDEGEIILDRTPFYGESGGQEGDSGVMTSRTALMTVLDTKKPQAGIHVHIIKVTKGTVASGDQVACSVDRSLRRAVMRNHTATHLLHKALRMVLGDHVKQSGSVVDHERLRFDFTHFAALTDDEIFKVEEIMNDKILENIPVTTDVMRVEEAMKTGAMALFDEKYGETVRVVTAGDFSKELCGGTHSGSTGEIGLFLIISEGSVASGIRRIEALTGRSALDYLKEKKSELDKIKNILKTEQPFEKTERLLADLRSLEKEVQRLKTGSSKDMITEALGNAYDLDGVKVVTIRQDGLTQNELRLLADNIRDRLHSGIIILYSVSEGQASIVCVVTKDLSGRFHAGDIVKNIAALSDGRGGGKPEMAQGGTKSIEKLESALTSIRHIVADKSKAGA